MVQSTDRSLRRGVSFVQRIVRAIVAAHHNMEKPHKGISGGDPFVVAFGQGRRRASLTAPYALGVSRAEFAARFHRRTGWFPGAEVAASYNPAAFFSASSIRAC
jgi:hypothetical protein